MNIAKPLLLSLIIVSANAKAETVKNSVNSAIESAQTKLYDLVDKDITTVNFSKGGSALSEAEVRNIRAVYKSVLADTTVSRLIVASWSDREGIKSGVKLPDAQVNLAQKRSEAVKRILSEMSDKPIDSYNMAEDASWIEKTFRTKDAKVKEEVKTPGITPDGNVQTLASTMESKGGPGKAVVIVQRTNPVESTSGR